MRSQVARSVAAVALALGVLAGCQSLPGDDVAPGATASDDGAPSGDATPSPPATTGDPRPPSASPDEPAGGGVPADLTVEVDTTGEGTTTAWTLTCAPAGGDHPDPEAACAALAAAWPDAFDPVPAGTMCTQQYGGPQTAVIAGTVAGESVSARFSRTNGCEISRWDAVADVLRNRGGA